MAVTSPSTEKSERPVEIIEQQEIVVRFAGDSGDGMQLAGTQMTNTSAVFGNDISSFPDFPAEIRAPAGTVAGVSGYQLNFSSHPLRTPGDAVNALIAMNPAALKVNIADLEPGGTLIVNSDAFTKQNLKKAEYEENPLENGSLDGYRLYKVPMDELNAKACEGVDMNTRAIGRCKNFFALGLSYWLFGRPLDQTLDWIKTKFGTMPDVAEANTRALKAGHNFGDTTQMFAARYVVPQAKLAPGRYRKVSGNQATALGLITAAKLANKPLFYGSYPITPASDILHELSRYKNFDVRTFQAEDEIAAMASVIGAAYTGAFAVTGTSGPGVALKSEAIGLGVMVELPMVIVNVQRGGPSTGLPTKTEQSDLFQAVGGRHGETPVCVIAAATPADCFNASIEAFHIATEFMMPVMVLTDGYLANGAEPWRIPAISELPKFDIKHPKTGDDFQPYMRDDKLARPWALPGTPGLEHRIGGLEKSEILGNVCYEPENHERMVHLRQQKLENIADTLPPTQVTGDPEGDLLVIGWGSTYGAITSGVERARNKGASVSSLHVRYINPLPKDLGDIIKRFKQVLVAEMNLGQLIHYIRAKYLVDAKGLNKVQGKPFNIGEIENKILEMTNGKQ